MNGILWVTEYWTETFGWVWLPDASATTREDARLRRKRFLADTYDWHPKTRIVRYVRAK